MSAEPIAITPTPPAWTPRPGAYAWLEGRQRIWLGEPCGAGLWWCCVGREWVRLPEVILGAEQARKDGE